MARPTVRRRARAKSETASAPASTRMRRTPEEARRVILEATQTLLARHGPDAVGLKEVAREAGVSHALVSHYYGTYDALVEAALQEHVKATRAEMVQRIVGAGMAGGPAQWIDMLFDQLAHPLSGRLVAWAILSGRMDSEDFFPRRDQGLRFVADAIEARVQSQLGKDAPSREDIEATMLIVFSAALGYSVSRGVLWDSLSRRPSADRDRAFREKLAALVESALPTTRALTSKR